jgi:hypothetical protein
MSLHTKHSVTDVLLENIRKVLSLLAKKNAAATINNESSFFSCRGGNMLKKGGDNFSAAVSAVGFSF